MACKLCETRRPRRFCPGVGGDICAVCCGTERENTVSCPFECEHLQEARLRERPAPLTPQQMPHPDIRVTDAFLSQNQMLVAMLMHSLLETLAANPNIIDLDVREALDGLVRTYRTLESGLVYESRPSNVMAAGIFAHVQQRVAELRKAVQERTGMAGVRDADVLGSLVFLQRVEMQFNNGRKRSRAFLHFLLSQAPAPPQPSGPLEQPGSLLVP